MGKRGQQISRVTGQASLKQRIREALRSVFTKFHAPRKQVLADARRLLPRVNKGGEEAKQPNVRFVCKDCGELYKATEIAVDHIVPVGTTPEFPCAPGEWEAWMDRLFCDVDNLQCLCAVCHLRKSKGEQGAAAQKRRDGATVKKSTKRDPRVVGATLGNKQRVRNQRRNGNG